MKKQRSKQTQPLETDPFGGFHYDFSNEFYSLWLDPTMTYSCGYFATGEETLEEAQIAKIDLAFQKIGLKPGQRLLDIGCGWECACRRAVEVYGVTAVGIALSQNQYEDAKGQSQGLTGVEYRLQSWETYRERCDRTVSLGAFEHLTAAKYAAFIARCRELLSPGDLMLLQSITIGKPSESFALLRFAYFLHKELFHGAELPKLEQVVSHSREAGFELLHLESLRVPLPVYY